MLDGGAHGLFQIALEVLLDQVRDDLGVGLGLENVAFVLQLLLERQIVFDDAVVHHHDVALAIAVRVRVLFGGTAVRGPARVADAEGAIHRVHPDGFFQIAQLALGAANGELLVIAVDREARGIISAVFQALQAFQNDRNGAMGTNIADNATHNLLHYRGCYDGASCANARQSRISTRYSSITGLASTSCAMVSISLCACSRVVPSASAISKNLPWRTSAMAAIPEAIERGAHRLALRVEHGGLRSDEYASFHGELRLSHGRRRALKQQ